MMVKVSIIMPLYNASKYLEESLESVLKQTLPEFELICVDDGSTDNTLNILQNFADRDDRIKILMNEERHGAAYSRNRGMKEAGGKYLSFLDGDDIFEEGMLEAAYNAMEVNELDVVIYEYKHVLSEDIYRKHKVWHSKEYKERYCTVPFSLGVYNPDESLQWTASPWNKLYRRNFIESNRLEFQTLSCANDVYFVNMALMLAKRILVLDDERVMIYARDHNEPSRISYSRDPKCSYLAFLYMAEQLISRNKFGDIYSHYYYKFFFTIRDALLRCKKEEDKREFYEFLKNGGIDEICSLEQGYYRQLNGYIKNLLEQFKVRTFESQWYREEQGLLIQLSDEDNAKAVRELINGYKYSNKHICIWGMGANGISLLNFCVENALNINIVVDKSKEKQGKAINGYIINPPENIGDDVQVVIVATRHISESVKEKLSGWNVDVIDINEYLAIY